MQFHLRILFSAHPDIGKAARKTRKYTIDASCPIRMYGGSTGIPPIQVRIIISATNVQNISWPKGRKVSPRCLDV